MSDTITFAGLGIELAVNPILAKIGPLSIHWYGVIIAVGFLLGTLVYSRLCPKFGVNADRAFDVLMAALIGGIISARLYYVAFSWENYKDDPISMFYIWEGGLAIYGGLIGGFIVAILMCKLRGVKILPTLDAAAVGLLLAQAIGRWGNFVNMEAFGSNTTLPWGMTSNTISTYLSHIQESMAAQGVIIDPSMPVHPTFLYESLWNLLGFAIILFWLAPRRKFDGQVLLAYLAWYGAGRAWIEGLRTDSLMWGDFRVSQVVAIICAVVCVGIMVYILHKKELPPLYRTTYESILAVGGELYIKQKSQGEESEQDSDTPEVQSVDKAEEPQAQPEWAEVTAVGETLEEQVEEQIEQEVEPIEEQVAAEETTQQTEEEKK